MVAPSLYTPQPRFVVRLRTPTANIFFQAAIYQNVAAISHVADGFPRRPGGRFGPYPVGHHQAGAAGQAGGVGDYRFNRRFAFSISIKLVQPELHNSSAASCIVIHPFSTSCLRESRILGMSYGRLFISSRSFPPLGVCPRDLRGGCCFNSPVPY